MTTFKSLPSIRAIGLATGLCALLPAWGSPIEHAVDASTFVGFVPLQYGDHTLNAELSVLAEVDSFTFSGVTGQSVRIVLGSDTFGVDPLMTLRGPNAGTIVKQAGCAGNDVFGSYKCSAFMDVTLPGTGLYTLNVADSGLDEIGLYSLHIDQYPSPTNWAGIDYNAPTPNTLGHRNDSDYFAFYGNANTGVQFTASSKTLGLDLAVEIWDPNGQRLVSRACTGNDVFGSYACVNSNSLDLSVTGLYRVNLFDSGWDETGDYSLLLTCTYALPGTACPPIPEPSAAWLLLAGIGVLGGLKLGSARRKPRG